MNEYRPVRLPQRGRPVPPNPDLRDCHLYRFWVRHPVHGRRVLGYVGETVRMPFARLMEHVKDQPWADTILGWEVDEVVYAGKDAVLAAERAAVEAELPLYNYEWNLGNPHRVEIWKAQEQRAGRDRAKGVAPSRAYVAPARRPQPEPVREPYRPPPLTRSQRRALIWLTAWAVAAVALWWSLRSIPAPSLPDWWRPVAAASTPLLAAWWWSSLKRRQRRNLMYAVGVVVTVAVALAVYQWHGTHPTVVPSHVGR